MVTFPNETIKELYHDHIRRAWALPRKITVSEWADAHRILDGRTSAEPGQWRTSRTPYLQGVMDAFNDRHVHEIVMMCCSQVGKTESLLNMLGYAADEDPGPTLWVGPGETLVKQFCYERIQPMFNLAPDLLKHLFSTKREDFNKQGIALDRMNLHFGWAGSASSLASRPIRFLFMDEIDKYPAFAGKEADPIELATERTKTFWNRKIVKCSTPTTKEGYIWRDYHKTDMRRYHVPCPHCGNYQPMVFGQLKFPHDERDPQAILDEKKAWYECAYCDGHITDRHKQQMLESGVWAPEDAVIDEKGNIKGGLPVVSRVGFWLNALYSPWLTFSDIASKFLASKDDPAKLMNFVNSWLAEPFDEKEKETDADDLRRLCVDYQEGVVPDPVCVLTGAVDVHHEHNHFYLTIRGWAPGMHSWLIRESRLETFSDIANALFNTVYSKENGETLKVRASVMDSGFRTDEVYAFCRHHADKIVPIKGVDNLGGLTYRTKRLDKYPNGRPLPGGLMLYHLDTTYFKDKLHRMIHPETADAAQWFICKEPSEAYINQLCSEHKVLKRTSKKNVKVSVWEKKTSAAQNHYWDCEVYQLLVAEILRLDMMENPNGHDQKAVYRKRRDEHASGRKWLGNTNSWVSA